MIASPEKSDFWRDAILCLILTATITIVYWDVRTHGFVNYDDTLYVTKNAHVQAGLTWPGVRWAFSTGHASNWHPLTWLSHMADVELFGMDPGGHHLTNVFFHILNALLLFAFLKKITVNLWGSAMVSALFALHPFHVESVAWVAERKDVLSTFFGILAMWAYVQFVDKRCLERYGMIVIFFALSLMAKPMLVTLPFVLLLFDYWPLGRFQKNEGSSQYIIRVLLPLVKEKIPLFVMAGASCVITFLVQEHGPAVQSLAQVPLGLRIANAIAACGTYLVKTFWPAYLTVYYPHPMDRIAPLLVMGHFFLLATISVLFFLARRRRPYFLVGWLFFLGTVVPVIGIVQVGGQAMADRYTYVPIVGIFIASVWGVGEVVRKKPSIKKFVAVGMFFAIMALGAQAWRQVAFWKDSLTLFRHALAVTKDNQLAHNQLGFALHKEGKYEEAIDHLREALRITPQYVGAHINLGNTLKETGRLEEAAKQYQEALRYNPRHVTAMNNLGILFAMKGQLEESMALFSNALKIDPENVRAHNNFGIAFAQQGNREEAIKHFSEALRLDPQSLSARKNLEQAKREQGR